MSVTNGAEIRIATAGLEDRVLLESFFQLYLHDLSGYTDQLSINADGKFEDSDVQLFLTKDSLIPLKVHLGNEVVGFIFLVKGRNVDYIINDMFILRKYRHRGIGKGIVQKLFSLYKGNYAVMQLKKNQPAIKFWHSVYELSNLTYEEIETESDGEACLLQKFTI